MSLTLEQVLSPRTKHEIVTDFLGRLLEFYRDGTPAELGTLRQHCATCNALNEEGRIRIVGRAPYERYYDSEGNFLGCGYDPEPRKEELGHPHVGKSEAVARGAGSRDPKGSFRSPGPAPGLFRAV